MIAPGGGYGNYGSEISHDANTAGMSGGSVFGALISLGSSLINNNANKKAQQRQNRYNKAEAELAYQRQMEMWNLQNQYNSPANQMQLMTQAGLNPNMVADKAGGSSRADRGPEYQAARYEASGFSPAASIAPALQMYQNYRMNEAQIDNINQRTANDRVTNDVLLNTVTGKGLANELNRVNIQRSKLGYERETQLLPYQLDMAKESATRQKWEVLKSARDYENKLYQGKLMESQAEKIKADTLFRSMQNDFAKIGITNSDNFWVRILARMADEAGILPDVSKLKGLVKP